MKCVNSKYTKASLFYVCSKNGIKLFATEAIVPHHFLLSGAKVTEKNFIPGSENTWKQKFLTKPTCYCVCVLLYNN